MQAMPDTAFAVAVAVVVVDPPHPLMFRLLQCQRQHINKDMVDADADVDLDVEVARNNPSSLPGVFLMEWEMHFPLPTRQPIPQQLSAEMCMVMPLKVVCPRRGAHRWSHIRTL